MIENFFNGDAWNGVYEPAPVDVHVMCGTSVELPSSHVVRHEGKTGVVSGSVGCVAYEPSTRVMIDRVFEPFFDAEGFEVWSWLAFVSLSVSSRKHYTLALDVQCRVDFDVDGAVRVHDVTVTVVNGAFDQPGQRTVLSGQAVREALDRGVLDAVETEALGFFMVRDGMIVTPGEVDARVVDRLVKG